MPAYRAFQLDASGHVLGPPKSIEAESDEEAIEEARKFVDGHDIEIWDLARLVHKLEASKKVDG